MYTLTRPETGNIAGLGDSEMQPLNACVLQAVIKFVNKLPSSVKRAFLPNASKSRLKYALVTDVFYSKYEFMARVIRLNSRGS